MGRVCRMERRIGEGWREMILLVVEAEAMARLLSGRGKKRREREERKGRTGGQLGKRNLGLVRATGSSSGNKRREWSIRCLLSAPLHLELDGGSGIQAGTTQRKGKILLRHFGKWSGNLGRRAHNTPTTFDQPTGANGGVGTPLGMLHERRTANSLPRSFCVDANSWAQRTDGAPLASTLTGLET